MQRRHLEMGVGMLLAAFFPDRVDAADPPPCFELGARSGFGLPLGSATGEPGADFDKLITNIVPLWLDAGFRVTPQWYFGAYLMYGLGSPPSSVSAACRTPGVGCSFHDTRVGGNAQFHMGKRKVDPWFGVGAGFEWYGFDARSAGLGASGWEFLAIQAGIDHKPVSRLGVGPFVVLTLAQFDHVSATGNLRSIPASPFRTKAFTSGSSSACAS